MKHGYFDLVLDDVTPKGVSRDLFAQVLARVLKAKKPTPRVDIARGEMLPRAMRQPLSEGTVTKATAAGKRGGFLVEQNSRAERPGRPIVPLSIKSEVWGLVGVKVELSTPRRDRTSARASAVLTDLTGTPVQEHATTDEVEVAPDGLLNEKSVALLADLVRKLAADSGATIQADVWHETEGSGDKRKPVGRQILGVGVDVGGHVHQGRILDSPHTGERVLELGDELSDHLGGLPVAVVNDVNAIAVWQLWKQDRVQQDFAVVGLMNEGVGGALVHDGRLYVGGNGMAGEVGHVRVQYEVGLDVPDDKSAAAESESAARRDRRRGYLGFRDPCTCGAIGDVDATATPVRIAGHLKRPVKDFGKLARRPAWDKVGQLTATGAAFASAGTALGRGLAALLNIDNPSRLVLVLPHELAETDPGSAASLYLSQALEALQQHSFSTAAKDALVPPEGTLEVLDLARDLPDHPGCPAALSLLDAFLDHARGQDSCFGA